MCYLFLKQIEDAFKKQLSDTTKKEKKKSEELQKNIDLIGVTKEEKKKTLEMLKSEQEKAIHMQTTKYKQKVFSFSLFSVFFFFRSV